MGILVNCFLFMEWKIVDVDITVHDSEQEMWYLVSPAASGLCNVVRFPTLNTPDIPVVCETVYLLLLLL